MGRDIRFMHIGENTSYEAEKLKRQVKMFDIRGIEFRGYTDNIESFFEEIDVFVISSLSEGFSLVAIESMLAGVPVISTKCGGPEEIINHEVNGLLVNIKSGRELANAITTLADDLELAGNIISNAERSVQTKFSLESQLCQYLNIYNEIIYQ